MATAEGGGATVTTTATATSSYGGEGGAGGKLRRKPLRKPTTPYDRPANALRANDSKSSWFTKLVDPASKLISIGARRFFKSVFQKRLPPPPPPQLSESNHVLSGGLPETVLSEPAGGEFSNGISDLEQLLKQKTFTRSEIDHLTELLHSRGEVSLKGDGKRNEETVSDFGSRHLYESNPMEANRSKGDRPHEVVSTHISNSKVLGNCIDSPAELANSYMGSRPSKLSPLALSNHSQVTKDDTKLLSNMKIASKPVSVPLAMKNVLGYGSPEKGFLTRPSLLRRSAIYSMSRSPYSKRAGINHNCYSGLPMPSTSIVGNSERSELKTLKRRSSALDDEIGSVGPIRRIRQKSNLIAPGVPHTDRVGSNSNDVLVPLKQKLPLIVDPKHVQSSKRSTDISSPSNSYAIVPYEYNDVEVAVGRSGNLDIVFKDKSESKVVAARQNSPFKLTSNMLRGQALRSMEDATFSELLMNSQDDHKFENINGLLDAHDFHPQEQGKIDENGLVEFSAPSDTYYPVINNVSAVSLEASLVRDGTSDYVESSSSQPQNSPFKLTSNMLRGQALRSMEDATFSELLMNSQDDHKFENINGLLDAHDFHPQEQGKIDENGLVEFSAPSDTYYPVINNVSAVSLEASLVRDGTSDYVESSSSQPQNGASFRMSALEDYVDLDDDLPSNGPASRPFSVGRVPLEAHFKDGKFSPPEEPKALESATQSEMKSPPDLMSSKPNEFSHAGAGASSLGEGSNVITTRTSEEVTTPSLPIVPPPSVAAFDKHKEIDNPRSLFSFSSKVEDKFPSLMPESNSRTPASNSSLLDVTAPTSSLVEVVNPAEGGNLKPLATDDTGGNSDNVPSSASNGPLVSGASNVSFTAISSNSSSHQISPAVPVTFTPSVSVLDHIPPGVGSISSAASNGISFGAAEAPKVSGEPAFKFSGSADPSAKVSAVSTTIIPAGDLKNNVLTDSSSGVPSSSSIKLVAFGSSGNMTSGLGSSGNMNSGLGSSGNMTSGLSSSTNIPSIEKSQGSLFSNGSKSFVPAVGTITQGTSTQSLPLASMNSSTSFDSSLSSSKIFSPVMSFGLNSSASSSDTGAVVSSSGSTSCLFGVNPSAVLDGSAAGSSSFTNPSVFSFGSSSSSSSTNSMGSTSGAAASGFSFGLSSSGSAPVTTSFFSGSSSSTSASGVTGGAASVFSFGSSSTAPASISNAASSFSNGASSLFKFGGSSSASSSAINSVNNNNGPSSALGSSLQAPTSSIFGSSPATGFSFGVQASSSAPKNPAPVVFNSSTAPSPSSPFSFTSAPASVFSSPSPTLAQPVFGNPAPGFAASSPGNNYQMSAEDSMAEDPVQSNTAPSVPVFGQASIPPPASGFMFGSSAPSQPNPFQFGGQQNQGASQTPSMFQASSSVEFNAGGSFSLGSGGGEKSGRKYVKVNRNKNRKK